MMSAMKRLRAAICLMLCALALSSAGCGTISDMTTADGGQRIFGGTRADGGNISHPDSQNPDVQRIFCVLDFPFSLALDLCLLPVTVIISLVRNPP